MTLSMLVGAVLADRRDKRKLMLWARTAHLAAVGVLLANAAQDQPELWPIYLAGTVAGAAAGAGMPAFMAATPALVGRAHLAAAAALGSLASQASSVIGPALAGLLMTRWGAFGCYCAVAAGSVATPLLLARLPSMSAPRDGRQRGKRTALGALPDAFSYAFASQIIAGLALVDVAATLFATPFAALPQFGVTALAGDARTIGLMFSAPAVGAFFGALASGWTGRLERPGQTLILAVCGWGLAVFALGFAPGVSFALACLFAMGFADTISEVLRGSLLQLHTPDQMLGRLSSLWLIQATLTPALGNVAVGALAEARSARLSFVIGGLTCLLATFAIAFCLPAFRRLTLDEKLKAPAQS
jgi:ENTS family enterobactin (siderophore) exporter